VRSALTKLVVLMIIFSAVPIILYGQFLEAYDQNQQLLMRGIQEQGRLIVRAITPLLNRSDDTGSLPESDAINTLLERLAADDVIIRVLVQPRNGDPATSFFYFAAAPKVSPARLDEEREELERLGVLAQLAPSCEGGIDTAIRYRNRAGNDEIVTSITPLNTPVGCWAVVTSHSTAAYVESAIGRPYWTTPEVRLAGVIYALLALATLLIFLGVMRSLGRFARLARNIRTGREHGARFQEQNTIPELSEVAAEFDRMVDRLSQSARQIRRAAEDNAHAFKTPIAVIRQCIEPLQRSLASEDNRGQRALGMIGMALDRLDSLVTSARHLDETEASLIDPPRTQVDASNAVDRLLLSYSVVAGSRQIRLRRRVEPDIRVMVGEEMVETVVENLVDNALSFTPDGGEIEVTLRHTGKFARLSVQDSGPGVAEGDLTNIFERYFSSRGSQTRRNGSDDGHMGIGLWIVRRNVEAVGGQVEAQNRPEGGFAITVDLPLAP
jgi:two-component system sensor histidine kinase ChvG